MTNYKAFIKYLFSYLVVLFIPIVLISFFSYSQFFNTLRSEVINSTTLILEQTRDNMDGYLTNIKNVSSNIYTNKYISYLFAIDSVEEADTYPRISDALQELNDYKAANTIIENIFIIFKKDDIVLSDASKYSYNVFSKYVYKMGDLSGVELKNMIYSATSEKILPGCSVWTNNRSFNGITYIHPLPMDNAYPYAVLMMTINEESIKKSLRNALGENHGLSYIIDSSNNIISSVVSGGFDFNKEKQKELMEQLKLEKEGDSYVIKGDLIISYVKSNKNDWSYITVIPSSQIFNKVNYVKQRTLIIIIAALLIGLIAAYYISRKNYINMEGITQILKSYKKDDGFSNDNDKWDYINRTVLTYISNHDVLQQKMYKQIPLIQNSFFTKLLKGELSDEKSIDEMLIFLGLNMDKQYYGTAIMEIDIRENNDPDKREPVKEFVTVALINIIEKLIDNDHWAYTLEDDFYRIAIIVGVSECNDVKREVNSISEKIKDVINRDFGFTLTIGVGGMYSKLSSLKDSYIQARKSLEYKMIMGTNTVICYDDISNRLLTKSYYSFKLEKELMDYLKMGKYSEIKDILEEIVHNIKSEPVSIDTVKFIYFDIINTAVKAVEELNIKDENVEKSLSDLMKAQTVDEMYEVACNFYATICRYIDDVKTSKNFKLRDKVLDYIQENYGDGLLSVDAISNIFNVSSSYLSRFMKEQTGYNIIDYIHETRLLHAKELLETTDRPVIEIAESVGYNSIQNFSRVFKRYENISPTEYRDMCKNNEACN